jgi:hypothetical protein
MAKRDTKRLEYILSIGFDPRFTVSSVGIWGDYFQNYLKMQEIFHNIVKNDYDLQRDFWLFRIWTGMYCNPDENKLGIKNTPIAQAVLACRECEGEEPYFKSMDSLKERRLNDIITSFFDLLTEEEQEKIISILEKDYELSIGGQWDIGRYRKWMEDLGRTKQRVYFLGLGIFGYRCMEIDPKDALYPPDKNDPDYKSPEERLNEKLNERNKEAEAHWEKLVKSLEIPKEKSSIAHSVFPETKKQVSSAGLGISGYRRDIGYHVKSTWEANYARILMFEGIEYEYEPQTFELRVTPDFSKTFDGRKRTTYTPDFHLLGTNTYVEIMAAWGVHKGRKALAKLILFENQYSDLELKTIKVLEYRALESEYRNKINNNSRFCGWEWGSRKSGDNLATNPEKFG